MGSVTEWRLGLTEYKPEKCFNGYTIFCPFHSPFIYMVNMRGEVVHVWPVDVRVSEEGVRLGLTTHFRYLGNGHILINVSGFGVKELDWYGRAVWEFKAPTHHHDFYRLPNGNTLILIKKTVNRPEISNKPLHDDCFIEVTPKGEIVWEWCASDHFEELELSAEAREYIRKYGGDYLHCNSCEVLPNGDILTSFRHVNIVAIIDKSTGSIKWKWGGERWQAIGPHNPTMLPNGNILIYDNGGVGGYPPLIRFFTRIIEVNPKTGEIVWEYVHKPFKYMNLGFLSLEWGGAQRLPNDNILTLDANAGRLFEITREGEIVWEYINPFVGVFQWLDKWRLEQGVYRCYRVAPEEVPEFPSKFAGGERHVFAFDEYLYKPYRPHK